MSSPGFFPPPNPYAAVPGMPLSAPSDAPLMQDVACRKCGYNLRGLTVSGRCPECGTSVGYSLQGDLLRFCSPSWVDLLKTGMALVVAGILVMIFTVVAAFAIPFMMRSIDSLDSLQLLVYGVAGGMLVGWVLALIGWFLATQPDPSGLGEEKYGTSRKVIRISLIVGVFQQAIQLSVLFINFEQAILQVIAIVGLVCGIVGVIGIVAQLRYLSQIMLRIPDPALSNRANFLMYALGITFGVLALFGAIEQFSDVSLRGRRGEIGGLACIKSLAGLSIIIFGIMYILALDKARRRFGEQSSFARATWAAQAAGPR